MQLYNNSFDNNLIRSDKFDLLFELSNDSIFEMDKDWRLTNVNENGLKIIGYSRADLFSIDLHTLIEPAVYTTTCVFYTNQKRKKIPKTYKEFPILTKKKRRILIGLKLVTLFSETSQSEIIGYFGVLTDLTKSRLLETQLIVANKVLEKRIAWRTMELEKANIKLRKEIVRRIEIEKALKESEAEYRALFQNANDSIIIYDLKTEKVLEVNENACKIYEQKRTNFLSLSLKNTLGRNPNLERNLILQTLEQGKHFKGEITIKTSEGVEKIIDIHATKVIYKNKQAILSINRDITSKKEIQQLLLQEKTRRLSALIDGQEMERKRLSLELHDGLGQLLTTSVIYINQLESTSENKSLSLVKKIKEITECSIDEIRTISHNLMPGILQDFGLELALQHMINAVNDKSPIQINFIKEGEIQRFNADLEVGLYRITQEALNNSIKHSHATIIDIILSTNDKCLLKLTVKDNGNGFVVNSDFLRKSGNGINNMSQRSSLIGCEFKIKSSTELGTEVIICHKQQNNG